MPPPRAICIYPCTQVVYCKRKSVVSGKRITRQVEGFMRRELTWQAGVIAVVVSALVSASYPSGPIAGEALLARVVVPILAWIIL